MSDAARHDHPVVHLRQCALGAGKDTEKLFSLWNTLQESSVDAAIADNPSVFSFQDRCLSFQTIYGPAASVEAEPQPEPMMSPPRTHDTRIDPYYVAPLDFNRRSLDARPSPSNVPTDAPFGAWSDRDHDMEDVFGEIASAQPSSSTLASNTLASSTLGLDDALTWRRERISSDSFQPGRNSRTEVPKPALSDFIGLIYLLSLPHAPSELSLGLALIPSAQEKGFGTAAILEVLKLAFDDLGFHRVSVAVLDGPGKEHTLRIFIRLGFTHEGTRRRAVMCPGTALWRDSHHLGMLDTDWVTRGAGAKNISRTRWDEMLARHQREQEALLGAEERERSLKRTASTETLRPLQCDLAADSGAESASEAEVGSSGEISESERGVSPTGAHDERDDTDAINPFLEAGAHATFNYFGSHRDPFATHIEQASDRGSERFNIDSIARRRISGHLFDPLSDDERDLLLPGPSHLNAITNHGRQSFSPSEGFHQAPPESESEADISGDSESEAEHYTSALESDGDDDDELLERLLSTRGGRSQTCTEFVSRPYEMGVTRPNEAKRQRVEDDDGAASVYTNVLSSSARKPTDTETPDLSASALGQPTAGPSTLQEFRCSPPTSPRGVYSQRQPSVHADADDMESGSDIGSEVAWDVVSNEHFSGFETDSSTSSLSLQSGSDSDLE